MITALMCWIAQGIIGYRLTALVLLLAVSLLAMVLRMGPVMTGATLSALIWNFFFIPPLFTFHIGGTEDALMFLLYFMVATVNAVLSIRIREAERRARDKEEKEKAIALYNTVLSSLSHELRTPIAAIVGATDAMRNDRSVLTEEQRSDLLATLEEAGARLDRQVGNLLHMGRLESGMLEPKADWCDVNELIGRVLAGLEHADTHRMVFSPDGDLPLFKLDGGLLEHVVHNLVHNGSTHTPPGTTITVDVRSDRGDCVLRVSDDGPGMSATDRALAFEKFHRAPGARAGGTGLGLSIVKGFTEAMGGTVAMEALAPQGLRFTVRVPALTTHLGRLNHE
ncbi:MAG: PAS domain-containing sensor histidine kinase [Flavobacteriales bacterium]|nr:PAS domain-containing sensor histidine kinase [Flavobacteriales bacterium]